ncbi:hypothetical protein CHELA1G2_12141 [Hyphomicrobiales bacterium]|nr:hypothetical protein CHELA1G2_12141 [Hyphomicrobiales bacterium]
MFAQNAIVGLSFADDGVSRVLSHVSSWRERAPRHTDHDVIFRTWPQ